MIGKVIDFYNNRRPHMSIGMQTPSVAHEQQGEQKSVGKINFINRTTVMFRQIFNFAERCQAF